MSFGPQSQNDVLVTFNQGFSWVLVHPEEAALWMGGAVLVLAVILVATHATHESRRRREKQAEAARRRLEQADDVPFN